MPEISVIVPVYKVEEFLRDCIDSILNQTFGDYELILVDDGSPDRCGQICDDYAVKDNRIKVIHQENKGLSGARNVGLEVMTGNYITFIDSDDVVESHYLQILYEALTIEKADISCCKMKRFSSTCDFENNEATSGIVCMSGRDAARMQYEYGSQQLVIVTAWGKLFAKQLFEDIRFPLGRCHEDDATIPVILYEANKVAACTDALYGYRVREGSIMQAEFSIKRYDGIIAIEECIEYFRRQKDNELRQLASKRLQGMIAYYSLRARKAGFFKDLPKRFRMSRIEAIRYMRANLPYNNYEYQISTVYPRLVFIETRIRKLRKMLGLKVKE